MERTTINMFFTIFDEANRYTFNVGLGLEDWAVWTDDKLSFGSGRSQRNLAHCFFRCEPAEFLGSGADVIAADEVFNAGTA